MPPQARRVIVDPLAYAVAERAPGIPPPQRVSHVATLWWWLALATVVCALSLSHRISRPDLAPVRAPPASESAAFHAFSFGDVRANDPLALDPGVLREQLEHLRDSGAHAVRLGQVKDFVQRGAPLPAHPVLLVFENAGRETIDAADPILADLGLVATAFVSAPDVARANIALVSKRRLDAMARSGRWDFGLRGCRSNVAEPAEAWRAQLASLTEWTGATAQAISCLRGTPAAAPWADALAHAALPLGFVGRVAGANLRGDPAAQLRLIRMPSTNRDPDALVRRAIAPHQRHAAFVDDFSHGLSSDWIVDSAHVDRAGLWLTAPAGGGASAMTLGGTERWRDAVVSVELTAPPRGQFWIYARYTGPDSFVRLGINDQKVVLQKATAGAPTRQLASTPLPAGPTRLTLRVIGSRALASLNGQPLLDRPVEVPDELTEGPVMLTAWDPETGATAPLRRVELAPLARTAALVSASPGPISFERLRARADDLWGLSPRLYGWRDGGPEAVELDPVVAMFASLHRLALLPAVTLAALPQGDDFAPFRDQLLQWAAAPGVTGLNLVVARLAPEPSADVEKLRRDLAAIGKELAITRLEPQADAPKLQWIATGAADPGSFSVQGDAPRAPPT